MELLRLNWDTELLELVIPKISDYEALLAFYNNETNISWIKDRVLITQLMCLEPTVVKYLGKLTYRYSGDFGYYAYGHRGESYVRVEEVIIGIYDSDGKNIARLSSRGAQPKNKEYFYKSDIRPDDTKTNHAEVDMNTLAGDLVDLLPEQGRRELGESTKLEILKVAAGGSISD